MWEGAGRGTEQTLRCTCGQEAGGCRWCGLHTPAVWVRAWTKCTLHQLQKQYLVHALDREDKKEGLLQLVTEEFNEYLFQIQSRVMCVWYLWKYPYCCAIVSVQCAVVSTAFSADTVTRPPIAHTADTGLSLSRWGHATWPAAAAAEIDNYIPPLRWWPFDTCRDSIRVGDTGQNRGTFLVSMWVLYSVSDSPEFATWPSQSACIKWAVLHLDNEEGVTSHGRLSLESPHLHCICSAACAICWGTSVCLQLIAAIDQDGNCHLCHAVFADLKL